MIDAKTFPGVYEVNFDVKGTENKKDNDENCVCGTAGCPDCLAKYFSWLYESALSLFKGSDDIFIIKLEYLPDQYSLFPFPQQTIQLIHSDLAPFASEHAIAIGNIVAGFDQEICKVKSTVMLIVKGIKRSLLEYIVSIRNNEESTSIAPVSILHITNPIEQFAAMLNEQYNSALKGPPADDYGYIEGNNLDNQIVYFENEFRGMLEVLTPKDFLFLYNITTGPLQLIEE